MVTSHLINSCLSPRCLYLPHNEVGGAVSSSTIDVLSCWTSILRLCRSLDAALIEHSPTHQALPLTFAIHCIQLLWAVFYLLIYTMAPAAVLVVPAGGSVITHLGIRLGAVSLWQLSPVFSPPWPVLLWSSSRYRFVVPWCTDCWLAFHGEYWYGSVC